MLTDQCVSVTDLKKNMNAYVKDLKRDKIKNNLCKQCTCGSFDGCEKIRKNDERKQLSEHLK